MSRVMIVAALAVSVLISEAEDHKAFAFACTISATNLAFGNVDVNSSSPTDSIGTLSLTCTGSPSNKFIRMCVSINGGTASDATSRFMTSGANQLRFQLYSNAARTTAWGSWPLGLYGGGFTWDVFCTSATCTGTTSVYGRVPGSQSSVPPGSYSSSLGLFFTYENSNNTACPFTGKGNSSTSFTASATVVQTCQVTATNLNFGNAGILSSNIDATSTVSVTCNNGTSYSVGLSAGNGSGATVSARKMTKASTTNTTTYSLYRDASRSQVWGTTIGTNTQSGTGNGSAQSLTVYGRVPAQTTPPPGVYTDTIVVTVTY